ncbi:MAG TPA: hypothetical protein GXX19_08995 [Syntrophomonadaceae bacterium]|nr:hypothetical protein [Syntrophomonadaceae bacterium]
MANENERRKKRLSAKQRAFLAAYAETGNITRAAELSKTARVMHYTWLEKSEAYRQAFAEAEEMAADRLEQEARRRAIEGVQKPVFHKGQVCGTVTEYSDTLLIFLLKGARPEKYKERSNVELENGASGEPLRIIIGGQEIKPAGE